MDRLPGGMIRLDGRPGVPSPLWNRSDGSRGNNTREVVMRCVGFYRGRGRSRCVPRLIRRHSVQDPLAITSEARGVILPSFGRRLLGLPSFAVNVPEIVLLRDR